MKKILFLSAALAGIVSCTDDKVAQNGNNKVSANENALTENLTAWNGKSGGFMLAINEKIVYDNIVIYPIKADDDFVAEHNSMGDYKTLKEGVDAGKIIVSERGGSENFANTAAVPNRRRESSRNVQREPLRRSGSNSGNSLIGNGMPQIGTVINSQLNSNSAREALSNNNIGDDQGQSVNNLSIENQGEDTVFVMAGELVRGGDQDRVVAEDIVLMPHSGKKDLPVFCVEHGRWTHDGYYDNSSNFGSVNNVVANSVRKIVVTEKLQEAVWSQVANVTSLNAAVSATGSYNALEESKDFTDKREKYLTAIQNVFEKDSKVIGVLVCNKKGEVLGCDMFCKNKLFKKEYEGLIHSYIAEVVSPESKNDTGKKATAQEYFAAVVKEYRGEDNNTLGKKFVYKGKAVHYSGF
ncbi:MAG: hypothetical protein IAF38_22055 [Bacteroidia bacterium]|nr:hypothetical protein [Bacteroidia bacterium]